MNVYARMDCFKQNSRGSLHQFQIWDNGEPGENKPKSPTCPFPLKNIFRQQYQLGKARGNNTATTTL